MRMEGSVVSTHNSEMKFAYFYYQIGGAPMQKLSSQSFLLSELPARAGYQPGKMMGKWG